MCCSWYLEAKAGKYMKTSEWKTCHECNGAGYFEVRVSYSFRKVSCFICKGSGRTWIEKKVSPDLWKGLKNGDLVTSDIGEDHIAGRTFEITKLRKDGSVAIRDTENGDEWTIGSDVLVKKEVNT